MTKRLEGKIAVVSGIASGIGQATALRFAMEGAIVFGADIDSEGARSTVEQATANGTRIDFDAPVDIFSEDDVTKFMDRVGWVHGRIDILVNAAAVAEFGWIEELSAAQFRRTLIGEVDSVFMACKAAWPYLKVRGGAIVNFASVAARMAVEALPTLAHCAGKGAVLARTRQLAMEGAPRKIRANTISPGITITSATASALEGDTALTRAVQAKLMLERYGQPADIAAGCVYLASDEASWVTAADLAIDGGMAGW